MIVKNKNVHICSCLLEYLTVIIVQAISRMKNTVKATSLYITCDTDSFGNGKHKFHDFKEDKHRETFQKIKFYM